MKFPEFLCKIVIFCSLFLGYKKKGKIASTQTALTTIYDDATLEQNPELSIELSDLQKPPGVCLCGKKN